MNTAPFWDYVIESGVRMSHVHVAAWAEIDLDGGDGVGEAISQFGNGLTMFSGHGWLHGLIGGDGTGYQVLVYNGEAERLILF